MKCNKCNHVIPEESEYCPFCGSPVEKEDRCPECGQVLPDDSMFCPYCGHKLLHTSQDAKEISTSEGESAGVHQEKKARKKQLISFAIAALVLIILAGGYYGMNVYLANQHSDAEDYTASLSTGSTVNEVIVSVLPKDIIKVQYAKPESFLICKSKTQNGDTLWIYISVSKYKAVFDSSLDSIGKQSSPLSTPPTNIVGRVIDTESIEQGLAESYGEKIVYIDKAGN